MSDFSSRNTRLNLQYHPHLNAQHPWRYCAINRSMACRLLKISGILLLVALMNIIGLLVAQTSFKCVEDSTDNLENPGLTRMDNSVNLRE